MDNSLICFKFVLNEITLHITLRLKLTITFFMLEQLSFIYFSVAIKCHKILRKYQNYFLKSKITYSYFLIMEI